MFLIDGIAALLFEGIYPIEELKNQIKRVH